MADNKTKHSTGKKILFLFPGFLILFALPLLIFRPVKQADPPVKKQERFTFMTSTVRAKHDKHDLAYWEKAGNPELFAKPDFRFGYSAFLNPEIADMKPDHSNVEHLPILPGTFTGKKLALHAERTPAELLSQIDFPLIDTSQKTQVFFFKGPVFLLANGRVLPIDHFHQPESSVKNLIPTLLKIRRKKADSPPEITVEQSCGDLKLDNAAMRVLFQHAAVNEKISGIVRVEWQNGVEK